MKKIISMLLVAVMVLALFAACGPAVPNPTKDPNPTNPPATQGGNTPEPTNAPEPTAPDLNAAPDLSGVTIKILVNSAFTAGVDYTTILPRWKQVEERTGCKIEWECIDTDYNTVVNTRLSGDTSSAPDIIMVGGITGASSYIEDGLLFDLTQAYDVCPNIKAFYTETNPEMASILTYVDGGIYQMAACSYVSFDDFAEYTGTTTDNHLWYRGDIAKELGFEEDPETLEDWYQLLSAVKKAYPDLYPFDTAGYVAGWNTLNVWSSAFGVRQNFENSGIMFYVDDNGKVVFEPEQDNVKAWVTEMKKWNDEGLFHISTGGSSELYSNATADLVFASFWRGLNGKISALLETDPNRWYETAPMPTVEGYERAYGSRNPYGNTFAIVDNGDEDHCKAVAQFLDYAVYSEYGIASERMGPEGLAWSFDENGEIVLNENYEGWTDSNQFQMEGAYMWSKFPSVYSAELNKTYSDFLASKNVAANQDERLTYLTNDSIETTKENMSCAFPKFVVPYMETEDQEIATEILADLKTFVDESLTNYILGNKDLAKWDTEFVKALYEEFRLQELLDIYQKYEDAK